MTHQHRTLDELREEFRNSDVRGWLWPWLHEMLVRHAKKRIKGRYRPETYSGSTEWDDTTISGLVNEFIVQKGIEKGAIAKALLSATDILSFEAYVSTSFVRFVITERPRTLARNVFDRLRDVLDAEPDFMRLAGLPPHSQYGLAEWEDDPPPLATEEVLRTASKHMPTDIKWVAYERGTRESPGLSSADLIRIARTLFSGIGHLLTAKQIMNVIGQRYDLNAGGESVEQVESLASFSGSESPLELVEAEDLAKRAFDCFTPRQKEIIRLMLSDESVISARDLGARLGISKSTAANELRSIQGQFRLLGANHENVQRQVLDALDQFFEAS